jgi:hypothetical protein
MGDPAFRRQSAAEYFKELVEGALAHQRLAAHEMTAYYIVQLLTAFVRQPAEDDHAGFLSMRLANALEQDGFRQRSDLRQIGDASLFMSGFFPDSFHRKLVDVDYYIHIGGVAYSALSRREHDAFATVFSELAEKFVDFVDVLSEVSERSSCSSSADLLRLYERWLKTGSARSGQLLAERGLVPNEVFRNLRIQ